MAKQNRSETAVRAVAVDNKREAILRAAIKVFVEKGYSNSKVADIAKETGIADGTVYLYFHSKEDILHSIFDRATAEVIEEGTRELAHFDKEEDKLWRVATAEANIQNNIRKGKKSSVDILQHSVEILDEKVDAKHETIKAEEIKQSSEEDLESLLKLAEELKEKIDKPGNRIKMFRLVQICYFFLSLFLIILFTSTNNISSSNVLYDGNSRILYFTLPVLVALMCEFYIRTYKNRVLPDKLALKEVLQLLREVHGTIAEREDWSVLKRAEFRIRLSRFDLSEKKDSVFSFFS